MSSLLGFPLHINVLKVLRSSVVRSLLTKCYPKELRPRMLFSSLKTLISNLTFGKLITLFHKLASFPKLPCMIKLLSQFSRFKILNPLFHSFHKVPHKNAADSKFLKTLFVLNHSHFMSSNHPLYFPSKF